MQSFYSFICLIYILNSSECSLFDEIDFDSVVNQDVKVRLQNSTPPMEILFNLPEVMGAKTPEHIIYNSKQIRLEYSESTHLIVSKWTDECIVFNYSSDRPTKLVSTVGISSAHMFGGSVTADAHWPYRSTHDEKSFTCRLDSEEAVLEPYWVLSNGYYVYVDNAVPLFLEKFNSIFKLKAEKRSPYVKRRKLALNYVLCKLSDINQAQKHAIRHFLGKPSTMPDTKLVSNLGWSTASKFGNVLDQSKVLEFGKDIATHGFAGQLRMDKNWDVCPGVLEPGDSFPALKNLTDELKLLNFSVAVAVDAYVDYKCADIYDEGAENNYFVKNDRNETFTWSEQNSRIIDLTNPKARNWYLNRLRNLHEVYGVDAIKLDNVFGSSADSFTFLPQPPIFHTMAEDHPDTNLKESAKVLAGFGSNVQTSTARNMQKYGFYVRMLPRATSWDLPTQWGQNSGLKSIIPTLLQLNILGYSFVVPDKIGGNNGYNDLIGSSELYIRWTQLNVFMPTMEFSVPPWEFDDPRVSPTVKKFLDLRARYTSYIIDLMKEHVETGDPVNRPLWWIAPTDDEALKCDNEFLLGDKILVAPILQRGGRKRNIYLPAGSWKDGNSEKTYNGSSWLKDYPAALDVLPYFINMRPSSRQTAAMAATNPTH